jgi:multidrug efflux pump subunit AcrB
MRIPARNWRRYPADCRCDPVEPCLSWRSRSSAPIPSLHERQLASLVDDISRIEAVSYEGVGVEKIYLHDGAEVTRAISQLASSALVVLKHMPPNITPPLVLRYGATDVPIIQLSLSSKVLPDTKLNDLGQNIIRPARGLSPSDVSAALQHQDVILPSGDVKIGDKDYSLAMNNSPEAIAAINAFPIKDVGGRMVFMRDVAHVHDGFQVQTNSGSVNGVPGALMSIRKTGGVSTLAVIDGVRAALLDIEKVLPKGVTVKALFDQSVFVRAALNSVLLSASMDRSPRRRGPHNRARRTTCSSPPSRARSPRRISGLIRATA